MEADKVYPILLPSLMERVGTLQNTGTIGLVSVEQLAPKHILDYPPVLINPALEYYSAISKYAKTTGIAEATRVVVAPTTPIFKQRSLDKLMEQIVEGLGIPIDSLPKNRTPLLYRHLHGRDNSKKIFIGRSIFLETIRKLTLTKSVDLVTQDLQNTETADTEEMLKQEISEAYHHRCSELLLFPSTEVAKVYLQYQQKAGNMEGFRTGVFLEMEEFIREKFLKRPQDLESLLELALIPEELRSTSERGRQLIAGLRHVWGRRPFEPLFARRQRL